MYTETDIDCLLSQQFIKGELYYLVKWRTSKVESWESHTSLMNCKLKISEY